MELEISKRTYPFLQGGGEMGELTRSFEWEQTSVGSPGEWPQSLRTTVSNLLRSRFPMFLWWGDDLIQFYNDSYRPSLGSNGKHSHALGQKGKECWPEIWDTIFPLIRKVKTTGEPTWNENQLIPIYRNGNLEDVYWTFSYSLVLNDENEAAGVLVTCMETTETFNSQRKISESENNLRNMILQAPVCMAILKGPEFVVEIANESMYKLWGRSKNELLHKSIFEGVPEAKNQGFEGLLSDVLTTGRTFSAPGIAVNLPRADGVETRYVNLLYEPFRESNGMISGVMVVAIDVTEQVVANQKIEEMVIERTMELAQANGALLQTNKELEQFAYVASHDLQEPLRKVCSFADMLKLNLGEVDSRSTMYLEKITSSAHRMIRLINDVLHCSQLSADGVSSKNVDLESLVQSIVSDFELLIEQKGATIKYANLPTLNADASQMQQLFGNLISNALKFSKADVPPVLAIAARLATVNEKGRYQNLFPEREYFIITVTDNGIGFNQEYADRIFRIFERLHGSKEFAGTGIGLALCKKIAQNHQGEIWATSGNENGSVFHVILPK